ncbi:phosphotransferase [Paenibacillus kobensis]|uniref:phosphotransferase n=1 Tax=Paenibacillus kobensis TaxID=59841 RepID=UPI000FDBEFC3|nr:phosphotransferase [Paenibacillus kobensis]
MNADAKLDQLVRHYVDEDIPYSIEPVPFGLTNVTRIVRIQESRYIIRIYNEYTKDVPGIELESQVTSYLNRCGLSFQVPELIHTRTGENYVQFPDGTLGAMVSFLNGSAPQLADASQVRGFGRVVGEIAATLGRFDAGELSYYGCSFTQVYGLHSLAGKDAVQAFMQKPPFPVAEDAIAFYYEMLKNIERSSERITSLPKQLVHHDLLVFNLLAEDHGISGVLDFDFISLDAGIMELAIALNHVLQMSDGSLDMAEAFLQGYAEHRSATASEIDCLQLMTQIYHVAVLHIYIGQHYTGSKVEPQFSYIMQQFRSRNDWLERHDTALRSLLEVHLL